MCVALTEDRTQTSCRFVAVVFLQIGAGKDSYSCVRIVSTIESEGWRVDRNRRGAVLGATRVTSENTQTRKYEFLFVVLFLSSNAIRSRGHAVLVDAASV